MKISKLYNAEQSINQMSKKKLNKLISYYAKYGCKNQKERLLHLAALTRDKEIKAANHKSVIKRLFKW